jgi:hypothetical protein
MRQVPVDLGMRGEAGAGGNTAGVDEMTRYSQDYEYVRTHYNVPAEKGRRVRAYGKPGTIVRAYGNYIGIQKDGEKIVGQYHPKDGIEYLDENGKVIS